MWSAKKKRVYLDWAAAAPVSAVARKAFCDALLKYGNPGALHEEAREARAILEDARTSIARWAEVKTDGVIFTSGATEANALALLGAVRARGVAGAHLLYHPAQHASVVGALQVLAKEGAVLEEVNLAAVGTQIRPETVLVTLDAVNSETGELFDTRSVRRSLDAVRHGILLHVDACQAPATESCTLAHLGADMVTLDAQKVGGVRGIGALLVRQGVTLTPLTRGGGQEGGRRPGTESPALASAFAAALLETQAEHHSFATRAKSMRARLLQNLASIPHLAVNEGAKNVPHILNVSLLGRDSDYAVTLLDTEGFAVSTKSACETDEAGSRAVCVLAHDDARAMTTLRISWGRTTTETDLKRFAEALVRTTRFLDDMAIYYEHEPGRP